MSDPLAAALQGKRWADAERELHIRLALAPRDPDALKTLAYVLAKQNRLVEAQPLAALAAEIKPNAESLELLTRIYAANGSHDAAAAAAKQLCEIDPNNPAHRLLLAKMLFAAGDNEAAGLAYRDVVTQPNPRIEDLARFVYLRRATAQSEVIATLRAQLTKPEANALRRAQLYRLLLPCLEDEARKSMNLSRANVASLADTNFRFAVTDFAAWRDAATTAYREQPNASAGLHVLARLSAGGFCEDGDDLVLAQREAVDGIFTSYELNRSFYKQLESQSVADITAALPAIREFGRCGPEAARGLFVACDMAYFKKYVVALVGSFLPFASGTHLRIHVFDPDEAALAQYLQRFSQHSALSCSITLEETGLAQRELPVYAHAIRYVRLLEFTRSLTGPVLQIDADLLMQRDPGPMFDALVGHDTGLWLQPSRIEPENRIQASVVSLAPTVASRHYVKLVAGYLAALWTAGRLHWGADQAALYLVLSYLQTKNALPTIAPVTPAFMGEPGSDAMLWPAKVSAKDKNAALITSTVEAALKRLGVET